MFMVVLNECIKEGFDWAPHKSAKNCIRITQFKLSLWIRSSGKGSWYTISELFKPMHKPYSKICLIACRVYIKVLNKLQKRNFFKLRFWKKWVKLVLFNFRIYVFLFMYLGGFLLKRKSIWVNKLLLLDGYEFTELQMNKHTHSTIIYYDLFNPIIFSL